MGAKLRATGPQTLISGYRNLGQGRAPELVGRVLDLTSGILARDPAQLRRSFWGAPTRASSGFGRFAPVANSGA
jgi:hypothetical protein